MKASDLAWELLTANLGRFSGDGMNHEGESFTGHLQLQSLLDQKLLLLTSRAMGRQNEIYHDEASTVGRDQNGVLTLFVNSNNHPGITPHHFDRIEESTDGDRKIVFRFGLPSEMDEFREEITIVVHADQSLSHNYAWGMPGGDFLPRSGSRMQKEMA